MLERLHRRICERFPESGLGRVEAVVQVVIFLGIAVFFLLTLEGRIKRRASPWLATWTTAPNSSR